MGATGFYIDCHRMTVPENILLQKSTEWVYLPSVKSCTRWLYREFIWHKGLPGLHNNSQTAAGCCRLWPTLTAGLTSTGWYLLQGIIYCLRQLWNRMPDWLRLKVLCIIGYESAPIHQCRFPGLAISRAKALIYFLYKIYGSTFIKQHTETVMVWNYRKAGCSLRIKFYSVIYYHFWHTVVSYW